MVPASAYGLAKIHNATSNAAYTGMRGGIAGVEPYPFPPNFMRGDNEVLLPSKATSFGGFMSFVVFSGTFIACRRFRATRRSASMVASASPSAPKIESFTQFVAANGPGLFGIGMDLAWSAVVSGAACPFFDK